MTPFAPAEIRYIKLGSGGHWAARCFAAGELQFGYGDIPHELCLAGDWEAVTARLIALGSHPIAARDTARTIRGFYTLGADCLWITFAEGKLYWTFAEPAVTWIGGDGSVHGQRYRKVIEGWRCTDLQGAPLRMEALSTRLTKVAAYRKTLCRVDEQDYLLRRIAGGEEPTVTEARSAQERVQEAAAKMIAALHWSDFETMVDLILTRSGWQRTSKVGGTQKDVDLILRQAASEETAFVQVKSRADQAVLNDYLERFAASGCDRMFFVCHSPMGSLSAEGSGSVHLWVRERLARMALEAGLFGWLIDKAG